MTVGIGKRHFLSMFGGAAALSLLRPLPARAQRAAMPVVALISGQGPEIATQSLSAFVNGLNDTGYVENQNVTIEPHWLAGHYDQIQALIAEVVRRDVAIIVTPGFTPAAIVAKAATTKIPIVFGVAADPVQLGIVASLARPGGNATGINFFARELVAKRLRLLHDLLPKALRIAVVVNPANTSIAGITAQDAEEAAAAMGLQIQIVKAATADEIDGIFAGFEHDRPDAVFVAPDAFFASRASQFAALAARDKVPAAYSDIRYARAGGLMSYGTDTNDMFRQCGVYTGKILKGEKPADLPVLQSTKFEFVINLQTARALGIEVPSGVLSIADEVIE